MPEPTIEKRAPSAPPPSPADRPQLRADQRDETREANREGPRLQRRFKTNDDKFNIPKDIVEHFKGMGLELEWKRRVLGGKEEDYYITELRQNYWEPLLVEQYPILADSIAPFGQKSGQIVKADQLLMVRPDYLCQDARDEQHLMNARLMNANRSKMKDAPPGTFERLVDDKRIGPAIRKSHEPLSSDV
jgi:hypothetical protein